jgi:hypothetical protein
MCILTYAVIFLLNKFDQKWNLLCALFIFAAGLGNLIFNKDLRTTVEWWKTQGIEQVPDDIHQFEGEQMRSKKLGLHLAQLGSYTNYYQYLQRSSLNDTVYSFCENRYGYYDSATISQIYKQDYVLMLKPYDQYLDSSRFTVLRHYELMNSDLLKMIK